MALLAASLSVFSLLPLELQEDYREMASALRVTPDVLVLHVLSKRASDWRHSPPVPVEEPPPAARVLTPAMAAVLVTEAVDEAFDRWHGARRRHRTTPSSARAVLHALEAIEQGDTTTIRARLIADAHPVGQLYLSKLLARMVNAGQIRRVRHGVYARATDATRGLGFS